MPLALSKVGIPSSLNLSSFSPKLNASSRGIQTASGSQMMKLLPQAPIHAYAVISTIFIVSLYVYGPQEWKHTHCSPPRAQLQIRHHHHFTALSSISSSSSSFLKS
ncbi:hypothetical protein CEXT_503771 [Caerostris extrusa]|uniref:Uncharacterized protein n=1 Tax=Caerostris extrusa TaxID=172846 RepID=A0AAV4X5Z4_CAEEX|nr:hypothetical protein CEXT_503771 [Caerostris extrusa]